eukprot:sb/3465230/
MGVDPENFSNHEARVALRYLLPTDISRPPHLPHLRGETSVEDEVRRLNSKRGNKSVFKADQFIGRGQVILYMHRIVEEVERAISVETDNTAGEFAAMLQELEGVRMALEGNPDECPELRERLVELERNMEILTGVYPFRVEPKLPKSIKPSVESQLDKLNMLLSGRPSLILNVAGKLSGIVREVQELEPIGEENEIAGEEFETEEVVTREDQVLGEHDVEDFENFSELNEAYDVIDGDLRELLDGEVPDTPESYSELGEIVADTASASTLRGFTSVEVHHVWLTHSVATRLRPGTGSITVNGQSYLDYFPTFLTRSLVIAPFQLSATFGIFDVDITVEQEPRNGGRNHALAKCTAMSIAKCLMKLDPELKPAFQPVFKKGYMPWLVKGTLELGTPGERDEEMLRELSY